MKKRINWLLLICIFISLTFILSGIYDSLLKPSEFESSMGPDEHFAPSISYSIGGIFEQAWIKLPKKLLNLK